MSTQDIRTPTPPCNPSKAQNGAVLLFTLIALVAMSLAALALVKNVDTATMIAGNLAFRQSATASAESGIQEAIVLLTAMQDAAGSDVYTNEANLFNATGTVAQGNRGYYPNIDPALNLSLAATWGDATTTAGFLDPAGNTRRVIIQRVCRPPVAGLPDPTDIRGKSLLATTNCMFAGESELGNSMTTPIPTDVCNTAACPTSAQSPIYRVTVRVTGPKNTVSFVQANVF